MTHKRPTPAGGAPSRPTELEDAWIRLVRVSLDDGWTLPTAAATMREAVDDDATLRQLQTRTRLAVSESPTEVAVRALATLDTALEGRSR